MHKCLKVRKAMTHWHQAAERITGRTAPNDVNPCNILEATLRMLDSMQKTMGTQWLVLSWVCLPSAWLPPWLKILSWFAAITWLYFLICLAPGGSSRNLDFTSLITILDRFLLTFQPSPTFFLYFTYLLVSRADSDFLIWAFLCHSLCHRLLGCHGIPYFYGSLPHSVGV